MPTRAALCLSIGAYFDCVKYSSIQYLNYEEPTHHHRRNNAAERIKTSLFHPFFRYCVSVKYSNTSVISFCYAILLRLSSIRYYNSYLARSHVLIIYNLRIKLDQGETFEQSAHVDSRGRVDRTKSGSSQHSRKMCFPFSTAATSSQYDGNHLEIDYFFLPARPFDSSRLFGPSPVLNGTIVLHNGSFVSRSRLINHRCRRRAKRQLHHQANLLHNGQ